MTDVIVIGAGLSGYLAAIFAAEQGASVTLIAFGKGGLSSSPGLIDIWNKAIPSRALSRVKPPHPYALVEYQVLRKSIERFQEYCEAAQLPYFGKLSENQKFPTALGGRKTS